MIHPELFQPTRPGLVRRARCEAARADFEADLGCVRTFMPGSGPHRRRRGGKRQGRDARSLDELPSRERGVHVTSLLPVTGTDPLLARSIAIKEPGRQERYLFTAEQTARETITSAHRKVRGSQFTRCVSPFW